MACRSFRIDTHMEMNQQCFTSVCPVIIRSAVVVVALLVLGVGGAPPVLNVNGTELPVYTEAFLRQLAAPNQSSTDIAESTSCTLVLPDGAIKFAMYRRRPFMGNYIPEFRKVAPQMK